jgi:hypothetical protein
MGWFLLRVFHWPGVRIFTVALSIRQARWCFIAAAMALVIKTVHSVNVELYPKLLMAILGATLAWLGSESHK